MVWLAVCTCISALSAQQVDTTAAGNKPVIFGLPLVFYTPETRWGFGAAGFVSWRFKGESSGSRPSQFQVGGAYTLEDQILAYLPLQLWWDENQFSLFGELGWYRYNYYFFGIGNGIPSDFEELYGIDFPRLRLTFMREAAPKFYVGLRAIADDFTMTEVDPEGMLTQGAIPGSLGGLNTGAGLMLNYDSRDNIFDSHSGWYAEANIDRHGSFVGSDFTYTRLSLDLRYFLSFSEKNRLAAQFFTESMAGEVPFISQALIGGTQRMRGFYEGRYRDNHAAMVQAEYRRHLVGRFGAVAFAGVGTVAPRYGGLSLSHMRYTYGAGLRVALDREDRINVRIDMGVGNGQPAWYITIGEAF